MSVCFCSSRPKPSRNSFRPSPTSTGITFFSAVSATIGAHYLFLPCPHAPKNLHHRQIKFPSRTVHPHDANRHRIPHSNACTGSLSAHGSRLFIDVPPVIHQIFIADQPFHQVFANLDENAEVGNPCHHAGKFIPQPVFQQLKDFHLSQFALGVIRPALGKRQVPP